MGQQTGRAKISVHGLTVLYGEKPALSEVSLDIPPNEITAVFGPASSGTTTFLRSLNRLCELERRARIRGEVLLDGENVYGPGKLVTDIRRRIGMVFEVPAPLPLSIFENVAYGPLMTGVKNKKKLAEIVEETLITAALWGEVKDRLDTPAFRLSGGQQQRLCIARVLAMRPEVLLLDRSTSGLDPISTAKVEDSLRELAKKLTVVIAPHNVQQAGRISDRAAFLLNGKLIETGPTARLFTNPADRRTGDYVEGRFG